MSGRARREGWLKEAVVNKEAVGMGELIMRLGFAHTNRQGWPTKKAMA